MNPWSPTPNTWDHGMLVSTTKLQVGDLPRHGLGASESRPALAARAGGRPVFNERETMDKNVPSKRIKAAYRRAFKGLASRTSLKVWAREHEPDLHAGWRRNKKRARGRKTP